MGVCVKVCLFLFALFNNDKLTTLKDSSFIQSKNRNDHFWDLFSPARFDPDFLLKHMWFHFVRDGKHHKPPFSIQYR